ncbi:MAG: RidA family protein, partial [Hallerella sp.]|nr:RidA family protein [Hallerella sp.]
MKVIHTAEAPAAIGPYSQAIVSGNFVFTSGQIPINPASGNVEGSTIEEQAEQACKNVEAILKAAGSDISKVVKTTCFLKNLGDFNAFNVVYERHFVSKPARICFEVSGLPKGSLVEIETVA